MTLETSSPAQWAWPKLHEAQRTLLLDVLVHGARSRADLARRTGLSRASLMRLTRDLVDLGFVTESESAPGAGRGRPSDTVHLKPESAHFAGFKLTGDALYAAVTDLHAKVVTTEEHQLRSRSVDDVVGLIVDVTTRFRAEHSHLASVGVCLAGDVQEVDGGAVVRGSHFLGWNDVPLQRLVETGAGLPTAISNDVQALTVAHHWFGAGVGCRSLAVIGLGAGVGAGIVANDELIRGSRGHPGKVGHVFVTGTGPRCDAGHQGCASAYVTIPAFVRNAGALDFADALARAAGGDERAVTALDDAGRALGVIIAELTNFVDPEKIVVTGEGLPIVRSALDRVTATAMERRDPAAEPTELDLRDFDFADYAWAAAISAIRQVV